MSENKMTPGDEGGKRGLEVTFGSQIFRESDYLADLDIGMKINNFSPEEGST
jgi:hypothetical protein